MVVRLLKPSECVVLRYLYTYTYTYTYLYLQTPVNEYHGENFWNDMWLMVVTVTSCNVLA